MTTTVVNKRNQSYDIYIGRGSKWGNPYRIGKDGTREDVIAQYRERMNYHPELRDALPELKGKVLGCFCKPLPCHGDVLAEMVDRADTQGATIEE